MTTKRKLIIIAGITGEIGTHFSQIYSKKARILGISRNRPTSKNKNIDYMSLDLYNPNKSHEKIINIKFEKFNEIIVIHSIGVDKFEHVNFPKLDRMETLDSEVYNSNVNTFKNLVRPIVLRIRELRKEKYKIKLKLTTIGSVADKHNFLMLTSFSESKNIVRSYIKNLTKEHKWIKGFVINVSSTITKSALKVRPHSELKYWLTPKEVVEKSARKLLKSRKRYTEFDIIKKDPNFIENYYINDEAIHKRWTSFTYGAK